MSVRPAPWRCSIPLIGAHPPHHDYQPCSGEATLHRTIGRSAVAEDRLPTPYSLRHAGNAATTEMPVPRHTLEPGQVASFRGLPARDRTPECLEESKLSEGRCRLSGREGRVQRERVTELHFIAPLDNLRSIMTHGVLSHRLAQSVRHTSIALPEVQERRNAKRASDSRLRQSVFRRSKPHDV